MSDTAFNQMEESRYSVGFWLVSATSSAFALLVSLGLGTVSYSDEFSAAVIRPVAAFCLQSYLFLQFSCAWHERNQVRSLRARVYFWIFASYPLWSIPCAVALLQTIYYFVRTA